MKHYKEYDKESIRRIIESGLKRDLHMHTYYSDGELSPAEIIQLRVDEGFQLLAITDHDGVEGSKEGMKYAEEIGLPYVSGIEFDSEDTLGKDLHILGYGIDYDNADLKTQLWDVRRKRAQRNDVLMKALNELGYGITLEDIGSINEGRYVGKPTFAKILANKGYLENYHDAFKDIYRNTIVKDVKKDTMQTINAIRVIHEAGGVAVLAHPMEQRHLDESFEDFKPRMYEILDRMRYYGIDGIECRHPSANEHQSELLMEYADMYGLMITEGSDFHSAKHHRDFSRYHKD